MKPGTVAKAKEMLVQILERGASCEEAGRAFGVGRSTVDRNIKKLLALVAQSGGIADVDRHDLASLPRLRRNAPAVLAAVVSFEPDAANRIETEPTAEQVATGARRVRTISENANRDVAIMYVLFSTGAKPIELARLRVRDYLNADGTTREASLMPEVAAIGGRERPMYFCAPRLQEAVDAYLVERSRRKLGLGRKDLFRGLDPDSGLFLTEKGAPFELRRRHEGDARINCPLMVATLRATFKRAGWAGVTAQSVRRQVARRLADRGANDRQLCEVLGLTTPRAVRRLVNAKSRSMAELARDLV